jgi:putative FmdB family regulatory protein
VPDAEETVPTYQYTCTACDHRLEAVQSFTDDPLTRCPVCEGRLRKLFGSVGIVFKGPGFYRTDSRASANGKPDEHRNGSGEKSSGGSGDGSASTTEAGAKGGAKGQAKDKAPVGASSGAGSGAGSGTSSGTSSGSSGAGSGTSSGPSGAGSGTSSGSSGAGSRSGPTGRH